MNSSLSKIATLTFTDVRKFSIYQGYNEFNKKLNSDRKVDVIQSANYDSILKSFNKRTCYLEFEPKPEFGKHCQVAFNLHSSQYNEKTNNIIFKVVIDNFFIDGVSKPTQKINGINCMCNLDFSYITLPGQCSGVEILNGWFDNLDGNCEYDNLN